MADFGTLFSKSGNGSARKVQRQGNDRIICLHYSKLAENPHQYRKFSQQDIEEMADLIAAAGKVLQPLLVRKIDVDEYEILAGHKRRAGAKFLVEERKLEKYALLPCIVNAADDIQARFSVVGTNVRPPRTPYEILHEIEEMRELLTLYPEAFPDLKGGRMVERLAEQLHMARSTVSEYRKIANNLGEAGMEALKGDILDKSAALELSSLPEEEQEQLIRDGMLTYTEIRDYRKKKQEPAETGSTEICGGSGKEEQVPEPVEEKEKEETGPVKCITGKSGSGYCGAAAYCAEPVECCAACEKPCNIRCGWLKEPQTGTETRELPGIEPMGKCAYSEGYKCALSEEAKQMVGDGKDCNKKCCWECTKQEGCRLICNAAEHKPEECTAPHKNGTELATKSMKDDRFRIWDVKHCLSDKENELKELQEALVCCVKEKEEKDGAPFPEKFMLEKKMIVAGLRLLLEYTEKMDADE